MAQLSTLMEKYGLTDEDCNKQVSDKHLEEFSRAHCRRWRQLPPHLDMDSIVEYDIDRKSGDEGSKRYDFFKEWKERKGPEATYRMLATALLTVGCRRDAECLCKLLQDTVSKTSPSSATIHFNPAEEPSESGLHIILLLFMVCVCVCVLKSYVW